VHIPVRTQVAFSAAEELVEFECTRCEQKAQAWVSGGGTGLNLNGVSVSQANLDARVGANQAARLSMCPRCGARDRTALAKVVATGSLVGLLAAIATGLWVAEQFHSLDLQGRLVFPSALLAFAVGVAVFTLVKLRSVRRRVRFLPPGA